MSSESPFEVDWEYLAACLPELEMSARECGALTRRRVIDSAETLLRLALVHAFCDHSLRETAAWAEISGVAEISDVALLKRFRRCGPWLAHLVVAKLAERSNWQRTSDDGPYVRLVDATHFRSPGPNGTRWRLHLGMHLGTLATDHVELTTASTGESLDRFNVAPGDLMVGDRGYAHRNPLVKIALSNASFLVRLPWSVLPLTEVDGTPFDLFGFLRRIPDAHRHQGTIRGLPNHRCEKKLSVCRSFAEKGPRRFKAQRPKDRSPHIGGRGVRHAHHQSRYRSPPLSGSSEYLQTPLADRTILQKIQEHLES